MKIPLKLSKNDKNATLTGSLGELYVLLEHGINSIDEFLVIRKNSLDEDALKKITLRLNAYKRLLNKLGAL